MCIPPGMMMPMDISGIPVDYLAIDPVMCKRKGMNVTLLDRCEGELNDGRRYRVIQERERTVSTAVGKIQKSVKKEK
jgi:hypothetical protein